MCIDSTRSEDIDLYKLVVDHDSEWNIVYELGKLEFVHMIDMNSNKLPTDLPYTTKMKEIEKAESKMK